MKEGHIFIDEVISPDTYAMVKQRIAEYSGYEKLILHIASPGGSVYSGYNIYNALKLSGIPIKTIIEGEAQSMATFIALAGDEIEICNPSVFMIHMPHSGVEGTAEQFEQGASELRTIENDMIAAYAAKTKLPPDQIREMMRKTTTLNAAQAKEFGFADKVLGTYIQAVALGQTIKNPMKTEKETTIIKDFLTKVGRAFASAGLEGPTAMDYKTSDGKTLSISEDGKTATVDGQPATGSITLEDGRTIICENGAVVSVQEAAAATPAQPAPTPQPAPVPAPAPTQTADQKLAEAIAKLALMEAEKQTALAAKAEAEKEKEKTIVALGEVKKEAEKMKQELATDESAPFVGSAPFAIGVKQDPQAMGIRATRTFVADNLPWLERHYKNGTYSDGSKFLDYRTGGPSAVSILETNLNYTWNGILATELFFKPTMNTPAISDVFNVDLGSADKKVYHIAPTFNKVLKPYTGCGQAVTGSSYDITSKAIQCKPFEMYESFCKDDFTDQLIGRYNILAQEWLKTGTASFDPAGTPIDRMITEGLKDAMRRDIWRRISFGDTTSSSADWNQIDGLWQSLIDQSGASNYCVYASKTNFGTGTLAADAAYNELKAQYKNSSNLLKQEGIDGGKGQFLVTRTIWENLYDSYTALGAVTELAFKQAINGISGQLTFRGIPVVPINIWDEFLADSTNPLYSTTRHLIAFTIKDNHILGVENTSDLEKIDSWFEKKDNKRYYRSNMTMGFLGAIHCDLTTVSY